MYEKCHNFISAKVEAILISVNHDNCLQSINKSKRIDRTIYRYSGVPKVRSFTVETRIINCIPIITCL